MIELGTSWEVGLTAAAAAFQHTYYLLGRSVAEAKIRSRTDEFPGF
jgi:hypothetical protein